MTEFVCEVDDIYRSACKDLPKYPGTRYCVLHFPGEDKKGNFEQVLKSKLEQQNYNFRGTVFSEGTSDFHAREFDANADFTGAAFRREANFARAKFSPNGLLREPVSGLFLAPLEKCATWRMQR